MGQGDLLLLLLRSLSLGGFYLLRVFLPQGRMSGYACHYGYAPSGFLGLVTPTSAIWPFSQEKSPSQATVHWDGAFYLPWHRHQVQGTSV